MVFSLCLNPTMDLMSLSALLPFSRPKKRKAREILDMNPRPAVPQVTSPSIELPIVVSNQLGKHS